MRSPTVLSSWPPMSSLNSRWRKRERIGSAIISRVDVNAIFDGWERAWSGRDPRGFESVCHPDVRYEDPLTPEPLAGPDALARHARQLWRAFPDGRINATGDRLSDGVHACAPCKLLGTHEGRLGRISPTGRFVVVHAVVYAELREERLLRVRAFSTSTAPRSSSACCPARAPPASARSCCCAASACAPRTSRRSRLPSPGGRCRRTSPWRPSTASR